MRQVAGLSLPSRMKAVQLPTLGLATGYPTNGTDGVAPKDINGSAVSIELFLGEDVLRDSDGDLAPVQMTSWNAKHGRFQGEITNKIEIQKRFARKVDKAKAGAFNRADWSDLDALLQHIIDSV